jgi:hypothetical protein
VVTYEFEADDSCMPGHLDACDFATPEIDAKGIATTKYQPLFDLKVAVTPPVGAFYAWRVRACDASARCGSWSEVRYIHVGRVREDVNGDGYGDLLAMTDRGIAIYLGGAQFNPSKETYLLTYDSTVPPTFSGDVNGDGFGDFFGTTNYAPSAGLAPTLYFGGPDVTALPSLALTKSAGGPSTLMQTTSAGDLNGDGLADVIVQWGYARTTPTTELRIFFGGSSLASTPDLSIPGPYGNDYTLQHSGRTGDINGDGFDDIALTAFDGGEGTGVVQIFVGGAHPGTAAVATISTTAESYDFSPAGDINGDGFDDVAFVPSRTGYYLYEGAAQLPSAFASAWIEATASSAVGGFDLDHDGFADFVIGTSAQAPILYRGTTAGPALAPTGLGNLTTSVSIGFSDHDGDGRPDLVGTSGPSGAYVEWAGSDGTINPLSVQVHTSSANIQFTGTIVR